MAIVSRLGVVLGLDSGEFNSGLGLAQSKLGGFNTSAIASKLGVAALGYELLSATKSAITFADEIADIAQANEMAVGTILEVSNALQISGGKSEDAAKMLSKFTQGIEKAIDGNDKAQRKLQETVGITHDDLVHMSQTDLFMKMVNGLDSIGDATERNALKMQYFGKSFVKTDMKQFAEEMKNSKGKFDEYGTSITEINSAMDIFDRASFKMKTAMAKNLGEPMMSLATATETVANNIQHIIDLYVILDSFSVKGLFKGAQMVGTYEASAIKGALGVKPTVNTGGANYGLNMPNVPAKQGEAVNRTVYSDEAKKAEEKLTQEIEKQTNALQKQVRQLNFEAEGLAIAKTEAEKLTLEFQKGGDYDKIKSKTLKDQLIDAAKAKDLAQAEADFRKLSMESELEKGKLKHSAREENKLEIKNLEIATERLGISKSMAGESDTQVQLALRYYDLQQAILQKKKDGLVTDEQIYDFAIASMNNIEAEEANTRAQNTFQAGWNKAYNNFTERAQDSAALGAEAFSSMANSMTGAIDKFVQTGKLSFSDLAGSIIRDLISIQLKSQATSIFSSMFGGMFGGEGGGLGLFSSSTNFNNGAGLLGGFFADGGSPPVNQPSIVGERGAELFVPRTAGTIIPNNSLSAMMGGQPQTVYNGTVIQNMNAIDTQSGVQFISKNKNAIFAANQSAQRSLPQSR
jgi:lambda family phage tail tape measure protein